MEPDAVGTERPLHERKTITEFLEENNALLNFCSDYSEVRSQDPIDYLERNAHNFEAINHAFNWDSTPSGDTYWRTLNSRWKGRI